MLSYKYNNPETAAYELTVGLTGLMQASLCLLREPVRPEDAHLQVMSELAHSGEAHFRKLTEQTPGFMDYFYEATPVNAISKLNIGSRPSHRSATDRFLTWRFGCWH